jgi:hypothetical protein
LRSRAVPLHEDLMKIRFGLAPIFDTTG